MKIEKPITVINRHGNEVYIRPLDNGWYELSVMAVSMGEEYREHKTMDCKPTMADIDGFIEFVNAQK